MALLHFVNLQEMAAHESSRLFRNTVIVLPKFTIGYPFAHSAKGPPMPFQSHTQHPGELRKTAQTSERDWSKTALSQ